MTQFCPSCGRIVRYDSYHKAYVCVQCGWKGDLDTGNEVRNLERFLGGRGWQKSLIESLMVQIALLDWGRMTVDEETDNPVEIVAKDGKPVMLHCNEGDFDLGGKTITRIVKDVKLTDG